MACSREFGWRSNGFPVAIPGEGMEWIRCHDELQTASFKRQAGRLSVTDRREICQLCKICDDLANFLIGIEFIDLRRRCGVEIARYRHIGPKYFGLYLRRDPYELVWCDEVIPACRTHVLPKYQFLQAVQLLSEGVLGDLCLSVVGSHMLIAAYHGIHFQVDDIETVVCCLQGEF